MLLENEQLALTQPCVEALHGPLEKLGHWKPSIPLKGCKAMRVCSGMVSFIYLYLYGYHLAQHVYYLFHNLYSTKLGKCLI